MLVLKFPLDLTRPLQQSIISVLVFGIIRLTENDMKPGRYSRRSVVSFSILISILWVAACAWTSYAVYYTNDFYNHNNTLGIQAFSMVRYASAAAAIGGFVVL